MAKAGNAYIEIRGESKKLSGDLKAAHNKIETVATKMEKRLSRAFSIIGTAAIASISVAMVALGKNVIALGREFENNMKTVQAWSGATQKELAALTNIARKMGATTEHTATEAAGALKFLAAAGFSAKQSIAALPGTLNLATAGQVGLAAATDITTDVLTAFGLEVEELSRVNDAFITTSSNSNTNVLMLGESFKMVAPTAHLFGLSIEETSAFLGTLANSGIKAEMAGSGLNMALLRSAEAAKKLGMDAGTPLIEVLKKMKEEQWDAVKIGDAFGARQVKTAAILMNNIDMYEKLTKKIIDNKGATKDLAAIIRDSLDVEIKTLNSTIQEELLRTFDKHKESIREIVEATTEWIRQNPQTIDNIGMFIKALSDLSVILGKIIGQIAEWTNEEIKVFQALGLASTGTIDFKTAMLDSAAAVKKFNEEMGPEKLRLAYLEKKIKDIKALQDKPLLGWMFRTETQAQIEPLEAQAKQLRKLIKIFDDKQAKKKEDLLDTKQYVRDSIQAYSDLGKIIEKAVIDPIVSPETAVIAPIITPETIDPKALSELEKQNVKAKAMISGYMQILTEYKAGVQVITEEAWEKQWGMAGEELDKYNQRIQLQTEFNEQYAEMGKSRFDIERMNVERMREIYEQAGIDKTQLAQLTSDKIKAITKAETEYKISQMHSTASMMADGFEQISAMGGKHSKEAFAAYKAFKIIETLISTHSAAMKAYESLVGIPIVGPALAVGAATAAVGFGMAQVAMISGMQPPSYDQGGISNAKGIYQTGDISEAHIPIPSGGKIPVEVKSKEKEQKVEPQEIKPQEINIVNVLNPNMFDEYLASAEGQNAILNVIGSRAQSVKRYLR